MHIVFAASECAPFAETGGLGEVVAALPPELAKLGHSVTVYLPLYQSVRSFLPEEMTFAVRSITIPFPYYNRFAGIVDGGVREGVQYYFVNCPELFDRDGIYGPNSGAGDYGDNAERFGLFCRAVLEASKQLGVPDIFHVHDWQTALLPVLLHSVYYFDPALRSAGMLLTIHNAGYQGWFPSSTIQQLLLPWDMFTDDKVEADEPLQFPQGWPRLFGLSDHGEPDLCQGDSNAGVRCRTGRDFSATERGSAGNFEWSGLHQVGSGARFESGGSLFPG